MVAREHAVAHTVPVEQLERLARRVELGLRAVLGEVAQVREEDDVLVLPVLQQVPQRGLDRPGVDARPVEQVLGVGHDGEGEAPAVRVGPTARPAEAVVARAAAAGRVATAVAAPSRAVARRKPRLPASACSGGVASGEVHTSAPSGRRWAGGEAGAGVASTAGAGCGLGRAGGARRRARGRPRRGRGGRCRAPGPPARGRAGRSSVVHASKTAVVPGPPDETALKPRGGVDGRPVVAEPAVAVVHDVRVLVTTGVCRMRRSGSCADRDNSAGVGHG